MLGQSIDIRITGPSGSGKTFAAQAIARALCASGFKVTMREEEISELAAPVDPTCGKGLQFDRIRSFNNQTFTANIIDACEP